MPITSLIKQKIWAQLLLSFVVSFVGGKSGFMISEHSGLASLVWPPAGISIVLLLYFGYRVWPAIFFGILFSTFNDVLGTLAAPASLVNYPHYFVVSLGATTQALLATYLVKRYDLHRHDFTEAGATYRFYAVVGPFCSLISSSIAFSTFSVLGLGASENLFNAWLLWWIADSCSAIVFISLAFAIFAYSDKRRRVVLPFIALWIGISFAILFIGKGWEDERLDLIYEQRVNAAIDTLNQYVSAHVALNNNLRGFKSYRPELTRLEFEDFSNNNLPPNPNVRSLAWIEKVTASDRNAYEANLRNIHGDDDIILWENGPESTRIPAREAEELTVVRYVEPYDKYPFAIGHVVSTDLNRKMAMDLAADTRELAMTAPVVLISSPNTPSATTIYQAHYANGEFEGFTGLIVQIDNMINEIINRDAEQNFHISLYDKDEGPELTFRSFVDDNIDVSGLKSTVVEFPIINRTWIIEFFRTPEFNTSNQSSQPLFIGIAGMIFAAFATVGIIVLSGQPIALEKLVYKRTQELEKANQTKTEFMANMSHDLRTPLNAIIGFSEIMKQQIHGSLGDEKYLEYSNDINKSSEYLLSLINDILDFAAIDANKREIRKEEINAKFLIESCLRTLRPLIEEKRQTATIHIPENCQNVFADERSIKQIMFNLISNAIKYTPEGGTIIIECGSSDEFDQLVVKDNGVGIEKENIANILDPFTRAHSDPHLTRDGTGLGLTIVNSLVLLHGGTLVLDSEVARGTTVTISLPKK